MLYDPRGSLEKAIERIGRDGDSQLFAVYVVGHHECIHDCAALILADCLFAFLSGSRSPEIRQDLLPFFPAPALETPAASVECQDQ